MNPERTATDLSRPLPRAWSERHATADRPIDVAYRITLANPDLDDSSGADAIDDWVVRSFELCERLDAPFELRLDVVAPAGDIDVSVLLGQRMQFWMERELSRVVRGICTSAQVLGIDPEGLRVRVVVEPAMAALGLERHQRVFQDMSVPEILQALVGPVDTRFGSNTNFDRLVLEHPPRDYCVQYEETDLEYALRLCGEAGLAIVFDHGEHPAHGPRGGETLVFVDTSEGFGETGCEPLESGIGDVPVLPLIADDHDDGTTEGVFEASVARRLASHAFTAMRWDWKARPSVADAWTSASREANAYGTCVEADASRGGEGMGSDGPIESDARSRARAARDADGMETRVLAARTNVMALRVGATFELHGHASVEVDGRWRIVEITHVGDVPAASLASEDAPSSPRYTNVLRAQPADLGYRPTTRTKPRIHSVQTAIVTGPPGEWIHTDRFGRIRVRMLWDEAACSERTSCWLRVAQPWGGDGFGTTFVPRVGSEVVVAFVGGDPDRPLCVGSVAGGSNMPAYELPENRTRTVLRTCSTDRQGFNELSFEDGAGREEVFLRAQRNLRERVGAHHSLCVAGSQSVDVGDDRSVNVQGRHTEWVAEQRQVLVGGHDDFKAKSARVHLVGDPSMAPGLAAQLADVQVDNGALVVRVDHAITLECGESRIVMTPDAITMSAPSIVTSATNLVRATSGAATLSLEEGTATLNARTQVRLAGAEEASLLVLDERAKLGLSTGGGNVDLVAGLDVRDSEVELTSNGQTTLAATDRVAVDTGSYHVDATVSASIDAGSVELRSKNNATLAATGVMVVRGLPIKLN